MFTFHTIQHKKLFAVRENKVSNRQQSNPNTAPEHTSQVTRTIRQSFSKCHSTQSVCFKLPNIRCFSPQKLFVVSLLENLSQQMPPYNKLYLGRLFSHYILIKIIL